MISKIPFHYIHIQYLIDFISIIDAFFAPIEYHSCDTSLLGATFVSEVNNTFRPQRISLLTSCFESGSRFMTSSVVCFAECAGREYVLLFHSNTYLLIYDSNY